MTNTAIRISNVSKSFHIGGKEDYLTIRDALTRGLSAPLRAARRLVSGQPAAARTDKQIWALKDVNLEIKRGEVVGLIGNNGAGKSTLLKILSRITGPSSGQIDLYGRVGSLLEVGTGFHPELSGRENIYLNAAILGMRRTEIDRKFDEIVDFAGVEQFIDTPIKHYSSGMGLRLGFAVAAYLEPEILMVDEVLAVGDAAFQKKCLGKMNNVAQQGRTVIFVSHNMAAVSGLCQRGIWLDHGQVKMDDNIDKVIAAYLSVGSESQAERRWSYPGDAPGDERLRLLKGRVMQSEQTATVVDINQPFDVEMEYQVLQHTQNVIAGLHISNAAGLTLFSHWDWRPNDLTPGIYRQTVHLPAQILADGQHRVLLLVVTYDPQIFSVIVPDALSFDAIDSAHPTAIRGDHSGVWPGVVRLALDWDVPQRITDV